MEKGEEGIVKPRDCLNHLEAFLSRRDGVDKLLKICRYSSKLALSSSLLPPSSPLSLRLLSFESSVSLSRKAFRSGKFLQNLNAIRSLHKHPSPSLLLLLLSFTSSSSEFLYYFLDQFVWLSKSGLLSPSIAPSLRKICASAELLGYFCNVSIKIRDLRLLSREISSDVSGEVVEKVRKKMVMKKLWIAQDFADGFIAAADVFDVSGHVTSPLFLSCCGLISAFIGWHKNWISS